MKHKFLTFFLLAGLAVTCSYGQEKTSPAIDITYEVNLSHDTILFFVNKNAAIKNGTLLFTVSANEKVDSFFLPVLDSASLFALAIPPAYNIKNIELQAYFYPKLFEIKGSILNKLKNKNIKAVLITNNKRLYNKPLRVTGRDEFSLPGLVFQDKATLVFAYEDVEKNGYPNIRITQTPTTPDFRESVFNTTIQLIPDTSTTPSFAPSITSKKVPTKDSSNFNKVATLKNVTVVGIKQSRAEKFNEENSSGVFNDANEKIIDCLENDDIFLFTNCLSFLQSKIAGLTVSSNRFGESVLTWRGHETQAFFIDEIPVDIEQLLGMPVGDIAIIKVYPPPFFGSGGNGEGGAIALYTRVGEYRREGSKESKWLFEINGYSPAIHTLSFEENN